jgi:copper(I)-binding protein
MKMEKDVMKMAAVPSLNVPAGGAVELKPGGYHVMLMDLKAPLTDKATVPITLTFENAKGVKSQVELQVPVRAMNAKMDHKH